MFNSILKFFIFLYIVRNVQCKLNIDVIYESLCPDSYRFIRSQLHPVWPEIAPYVNLNLIPFGKSLSHNDGAEFTCQHGPQECAGNRLQSCAFFLTPNQNNRVNYAYCFMDQFRLKKENKCLKDLGVTEDELQNCFTSDEGRKLQLQAEIETKKYSPSFIPTIVYNGVFHEELQKSSLHDFRGTVCKILHKTHRNACDTKVIQI